MSGVQRLHTARALALLGLLGLGLVACRSTPDPDPVYKPTESVLEVVTVLRRHVPDDTYRFPPGQDFTGRNVYRSSLLRLEGIEAIHTDALRASHMDGVIAFAKGRALERLQAYELAAKQYRLAADLDSELAVEAFRSADLCDALDAVTDIAVGLNELAEQEGLETDADGMLELFERRNGRLEVLELQAEGSHHVYVVQEELERSDTARAEYFLALRQILQDGDVRAALRGSREPGRQAGEARGVTQARGLPRLRPESGP
jgi:tetratricopeptide (TPR) repeat protein